MGWTKISAPEAVKILKFINSINKEKNPIWFDQESLNKASVRIEYSSSEEAFIIQLNIVAVIDDKVEKDENVIFGYRKKLISEKKEYIGILRL